MTFRLLARYKQDPRFSVLLPRRQGRKRGSHALLEGQERMISLQIQKVARTGGNSSLAALHRKIATACRKRRLPIPSYGTVLRRLRAYDARPSRRKLERPAPSQSIVQREKAVYTLTVNAE
jgi:putative transposase